MSISENLEVFTFRSDELLVHELREEVLVVFPGIFPVSTIALSDAIDLELEGRLLPDHIVLLVPDYEVSRIRAAAEQTGNALSISVSRGKTISSVAVFGYQVDGEVSKVAALRGNPIKVSSNKLAQAGLNAILKRSENAVLVRAKTGFLFSKPSSKSCNYFIRAEGLQSTHPGIVFIAFSLLGFVSQWRQRAQTDIRILFIDTLAIMPLAMCVVGLINIFRGKKINPLITSFHSYKGLETLKLPAKDSFLCLISASTTCGLADEWERVTRTTKDSVITLLSLKQSDVRHNVLLHIPEPKGYIAYRQGEEPKHYRHIGVVGENFLTETFPARTVPIRKKTHCPESLPIQMEVFVKSGAVSCRRRAKPADQLRPIYVDALKLQQSQEFKAWFSKTLNDTLPFSVKKIVFQDDVGSHQLAVSAKAEIVSRLAGDPGIELISDKQLADNETTWSGAVLVIATVIGRGSRLLSISRDLRDRQSSGARLYLVGAALPNSDREFKELEKNIAWPKERRYALEVFRKVPIGAEHLDLCWEAELNSLKELLRISDNKKLSARRDLLNLSDGLQKDIFWSAARFDSKESPLKLREEFAFWKFKYQRNRVTAADVFLTVSWMLQHARECEAIPTEVRLSSDVFQQVVLSPESFHRFNDGVIQAALIRAAKPSELDYSCSSEAAATMKSLLLGMIRNFDRPRGEALAEFVVAIFSGRIKLPIDVIDSIVDSAKDTQNFPKHLELMLAHIQRQNLTEVSVVEPRI